MNDDLNVLIITCAKDFTLAKILKNDLLKYKIPKQLIGNKNRDGHVAKKINSIKINVNNTLDVNSSLMKSKYAVVICSPDATSSKDVDEWVRAYKHNNISGNVLCYIISGEPNATDKPNSGLKEAFPDSVKFSVNEVGELSNERLEPIAADGRKHADGKKNALLKLLAGIYAVRYEQLKQRQKKRQLYQRLTFSLVIGLILSYLFILSWNQRKEEIVKKQKEYDTVVKQTFSALNNNSPESLVLFNKAKSMLDNNIDDKGMMDAINYRLSHEVLTPVILKTNLVNQFLLESIIGSNIFLVSFENKILTFINDKNKKSDFSIDASKWTENWNSDDEQEIKAIEIIDDNTTWLIVGDNNKWQMLKLNINTGENIKFPFQKTKLFRDTEFPARLKGFERNINLKNGQALVKYESEIGVYDANSDINIKTNFPETISWKEFGYDISIKWHRLSQTMYLLDKDNAVYKWSYKTEKSFSKIHEGKFDDLILSKLGWVAINTTNKDFENSSDIYHGAKDKHFVISENHIKIIDDSKKDQLHLYMKTLDYSTKEDAILNTTNGEITNRRRIAWEKSAGNNSINRYKINKQMLIRYGNDYINSLHQWPISCIDTAVILDNGEVHCIVNNQWLKYQPNNNSPQLTKTTSGFIRKYKQASNGDFWLIENQDSGSLLYLKNDNNTLSTITTINNPNSCILNLTLAADDLIYLANSTPTTSIMEGGPCEHKGPYTYSTVQLKNDFTIDENNSVFNLELIAGKGNYLPSYTIDGIYNDKTSLNWDYQEKNYNFEDIEPIYISKNQASSEIAITALKPSNDNSQGELILTIKDEENQDKTIFTKKSENDELFKNLIIHNFSPDGKWFWWSVMGENSKINWIPQIGQKKLSNLPKTFNAGLDYLKFSSSGQYLLHAAPYTSGSHTVLDLKNDNIILDSSANNIMLFQNKATVDFHNKFPWMLFNGNAYLLSKFNSTIPIDYPNTLTLLDFHPNKPWAAGVCAEKNICIADLKLGQIIFHIPIPVSYNNFEKRPQQVSFSPNGSQLNYVIGERTLVVHDLGIKLY